MMFKAMIIDLDDTLYLEKTYVISGFRAVGRRVREEWGYEEFFNICKKLFENGLRANVFDVALQKCGLAGRVDPLVLRDWYREHLPEIYLEHDADTFLTYWRGKNRLILLTDGFKVAQRKKIRALCLEERFDAIYISDEWGREYWKPSPMLYENIMKEFKLKASDILCVGDNPHKDFDVPLQRGMGAVRIRRPMGLYYELENKETVPSIPSFDALESILEEIL